MMGSMWEVVWKLLRNRLIAEHHLKKFVMALGGATWYNKDGIVVNEWHTGHHVQCIEADHFQNLEEELEPVTGYHLCHCGIFFAFFKCFLYLLFHLFISFLGMFCVYSLMFCCLIWLISLSNFILVILSNSILPLFPSFLLIFSDHTPGNKTNC